MAMCVHQLLFVGPIKTALEPLWRASRRGYCLGMALSEEVDSEQVVSVPTSSLKRWLYS